jgi:GNAT superfamily N-acetyltransferase
VNPPTWREEAISRQHDRSEFDCGDAALNDFLRRHARQSQERGGSRTFLAVDTASGREILGFYTLAPGAVAFDQTPPDMRHGLARHDVPGFRLARLAVDLRHQGRGLGGELLFAAAYRCLNAAAEVGGAVLIIDAKNDRAAAWYSGFGAVPLVDLPMTLVIPLATLVVALNDALHR